MGIVIDNIQYRIPFLYKMLFGNCHKERLPILSPLVSEFSSVLEVGCGVGNFLNSLSNNPRMGIDPFFESLKAVQKSSAGLVCGAGEYLPFKNNSFDCVIVTCVLHHSFFPLHIVRECFRVAKKRVVVEDMFEKDVNIFGRIYLDVLHRVDGIVNMHSLSEWKKLLKEFNGSWNVYKNKKLNGHFTFVIDKG